MSDPILPVIDRVLGWLSIRHLKSEAKTPMREHYERILRRDPCAYCGRPCEARIVFTPTNDADPDCHHWNWHLSGSQADHIDPREPGAVNDTWDNLTASCRRCNVRKRRKPLLRFLLDEMEAKCPA